MKKKEEKEEKEKKEEKDDDVDVGKVVKQIQLILARADGGARHALLSLMISIT